jgi:predicted AlkP superfamily phosphohydrolase/phosphomutase
MAKVAALGLDAAEWTYVEQLLDAGEMPHLAALRERSLTCRLAGSQAYRAEIPWPRFATGRGGSGMDYWGTIVFDPATYRAVGRGAYLGRPFWAQPGVRSLVFDVPEVGMCTDVLGTQVTAWGAHSPEYPRASRPVGLLTELDRRFGPHPAFANDCDPGWHSPEYLENLTTALRVGAHRRMDALEWLLSREEYDFVLVAMSESHSGGHHLWHGVDHEHPLAALPLAETARRHVATLFRTLDECVGRFVDAVGPDTTTIVFALHGLRGDGNDLPSAVLLPELLHRHHFGRGLLRSPDGRAWRDAGMSPVVPASDEQWIAYMAARFSDGWRDTARNLVKRSVPRRLREPLRRAVGRAPGTLGPFTTPISAEDRRAIDELCSEARDPDYQIGWRYHRHWPDMRAFALPTVSDGHIRVNVRGREAHGVVHPDDFAAACDEIVRLASECTDPRTGRSVVADAIRTREHPAQSGPPADVVIFWSGAPDAFDHPALGTIGPFPYCRTGEHTPNGFAFVAGPGIAPADLGTRDVLDLTPTIASLLGCLPADAGYEGVPLPVGAPA